MANFGLTKVLTKYRFPLRTESDRILVQEDPENGFSVVTALAGYQNGKS